MREIPPFYAGVIARRSFELQQAGRAIVPMHFGTPSCGVPEAALRAAHAAIDRQPLGYWESSVLRERIARSYSTDYGLQISPDRILLTAGASAALVAVFAALFERGDRIAIVRPGYPAYRNALRGLGLEPVELDCTGEAGFRPTAALLERLDPAPAGFVLASPANPTGAMLGRAELAAIVHVCRARRIRLISDEIYHGIVYAAAAVCALEVDPEVIVVNSFSKRYRMPGWRLGWICAPAAMVSTLQSFLINFFLTPPEISQHVALAAMDETSDLLQSVKDYGLNRQRLVEALPRIGFAQVAAPDGAFYLYADVGHLTQNSLEFCLKLLDETGIGLAPGIDFDPAEGNRFVRLSFALAPNQVDQAISILGNWLNSERASHR